MLSGLRQIKPLSFCPYCQNTLDVCGLCNDCLFFDAGETRFWMVQNKYFENLIELVKTL